MHPRNPKTFFSGHSLNYMCCETNKQKGSSIINVWSCQVQIIIFLCDVYLFLLFLFLFSSGEDFWGQKKRFFSCFCFEKKSSPFLSLWERKNMGEPTKKRWFFDWEGTSLFLQKKTFRNCRELCAWVLFADLEKKENRKSDFLKVTSFCSKTHLFGHRQANQKTHTKNHHLILPSPKNNKKLAEKKSDGRA